MGISCKPFGKTRSFMQKMQNELERSKRENKKSKGKKEGNK